jgi:hypothetical protein
MSSTVSNRTGLAQLREAERDALDSAVDAAYAADGFVVESDDGETAVRDYAAVIDRVWEIVESAIADEPAARKTNAVTKGAVVSDTFPSLIVEGFDETDDPELAASVAHAVTERIGKILKTDDSGPIQQRVGLLKPGYVLCQTTIGADSATAYYLTSDIRCIKLDLAAPLSSGLTRAAKRMARGMAMLTGRQPDHAATFDRLLGDASKTALKAGQVIMAPALEAATGDGDDE